jgi:multidrug resistance efflux pump
MRTALDSFTKQLQDNLEAVEDRAKLLKECLQSAPQKTPADLQSKLDQARTTLDTNKQEFDKYRTKLKAQFQELESEMGSSIEVWKANHEVKKLEHLAGRAENYAATVTFLAIAALEEAQEATLEAISARLNAATAQEKTDKKAPLSVKLCQKAYNPSRKTS